MRTEIISYQDFSLTLVQTNNPEDLDNVEGDFLRVEMPSNPANILSMSKKGFVLGDRTLGVTVNLRKSSIDYEKLIRFEIRQAENDIEDILNIAQESFPTDRRFHVKPQPDQRIANSIIQKWVDELTEVYVCVHKDQVVGFIDLEDCGDNEKFIHLAAVKEKYRAAGAALSMYAFAIKETKNQGMTKVRGRVSSMNTPIINLYSFLGGTFSEPLDVFLKER